MKKISKGFVRKIACLILAICVGVFNVIPASAAGTETWSQDVGPLEQMRIIDNNLTPVKTMGRSGTLRIYYAIQGCRYGICSCPDQEPYGYSDVQVTVEIRNAGTTQVLASGSKREGIFYYYIDLNVTQGQQIQLFFDVSSYGPSPGVYRRGHVSYYYQFI